VSRWTYAARGADGQVATGEVKATTFNLAMRGAEFAAARKIGDGVRLTMLCEEPDIAQTGPIARALGVDFNGRIEP